MPRGIYKRNKQTRTRAQAQASKKPKKLAVPNQVQDVRDYVNEAATPDERQRRKMQVHAMLYGGPAPDDDRFRSNIKYQLNENPWTVVSGSAEANTGSNPKTLMGGQKVPVLSVVPPASIIAQATAMRCGAYLAPRVDGTRGYGPYNWRDQPIEAHVYIDAAMRHLMQWYDGDESEIIRDDQGRAIDEVSHLAFALATIGILLDAKANSTLIDDRPKVRKMAASNLLAAHKLARYEK